MSGPYDCFMCGGRGRVEVGFDDDAPFDDAPYPERTWPEIEWRRGWLRQDMAREAA